MTEAGKWLAVLLVLLGGATASAGPALTVSDPWVREAPPQAEVNAAYFTVHNGDDQVHILAGAASPQFTRAELHASRLDGGQARMQHLENIAIPAHGSVRFTPGEYHLMLIQPRQPLKAGDSVELRLQFKDASAITVRAPVRSGDEEDDTPRHHDMHSMGR